MTPQDGTARLLIACLGNLFRGDDAFGVRVAERLAKRPPLPGATLRDFGLRGLDFANALLEPWYAVLIVDAVPRGRLPGALYALEIEDEDVESAAEGPPEVGLRGIDPLKTLRWARAMGAAPAAVRLVGCEPARLGDGGEALVALSPAVAAAVDEAADLVESLARELWSGKALASPRPTRSGTGSRARPSWPGSPRSAPPR